LVVPAISRVIASSLKNSRSSIVIRESVVERSAYEKC
jgi:hypothetical protein